MLSQGWWSLCGWFGHGRTWNDLILVCAGVCVICVCVCMYRATSLTSTVLFIIGDCSKWKSCWTDTHSTVPSKGGCKSASWGSCDDIISTAINTGCPPDGARNTLKVKLGDCGVPITHGVRGTIASVVHDCRNPTVRVPSPTTPEAHSVRGVHLHCYCKGLSSNSRKCISD